MYYDKANVFRNELWVFVDDKTNGIYYSESKKHIELMTAKERVVNLLKLHTFSFSIKRKQ